MSQENNKKPDNKRYMRYFDHFRRFLKNLLRNYFIYDGMPETIDKRAHEEMVLFKGVDIGLRWKESTDPKYKNQIIVCEGALAGIDLYQKPTRFVSANPRITPSITRIPGFDCVPCYNTLNYTYGETCNVLVDIYADMLANITLSMRSSIRNSKVVLIPTVDDDTDAIRLNEAIESIYDGDSYVLNYEMGELSGNNLFPIKAKDNIVVSELADARRSILADFFSETGVKTLPVDKKERANLVEMDSNSDQIKIACDIMLAPRKLWCEEMNKMFGTNISVKFNEEVVKNELYRSQSMENAELD